MSNSFWTASSPANTSSQKNLSGTMRSRSSAVVMTWRTPTASAIKVALGEVDVIVRSTPWDFVSTWLWRVGGKDRKAFSPKGGYRRGRVGRQAKAVWVDGGVFGFAVHQPLF